MTPSRPAGLSGDAGPTPEPEWPEGPPKICPVCNVADPIDSAYDPTICRSCGATVTDAYAYRVRTPAPTADLWERNRQSAEWRAQPCMSTHGEMDDLRAAVERVGQLEALAVALFHGDAAMTHRGLVRTAYHEDGRVQAHVPLAEVDPEMNALALEVIGEDAAPCGGCEGCSPVAAVETLEKGTPE